MCPKQSSVLGEWEVRTGGTQSSVPIPMALAQALLAVMRLKYSALCPPNSLFVCFLENWLPVPICF